MLHPMKKFLYLFVIGISLSHLNLYAVEHFNDSKNPHTGIVQRYFVCDNNKLVRIIEKGNNIYQFFSDGGRDKMEGKSALDIAQHVCRYYLDSH